MTMTEIARKAGVSQATVSRILSGRGGVSPNKVNAVMKLVKATKFKPQTRRRCPNHGQKNIGLFYTGLKLAQTATVLTRKYIVTAQKLPKEFNLIFLPPGLRPEELQREINRRNIVGLMLYGHSNPTKLKKILENIPHVWLNSYENQATNNILCGNEEAGKLAAEYLLNKGCTKLGAILVPSHNPGYKARIDGFLQKAYIENHEAVIFPCGDKPQYFEDIDWEELEAIIERTFNSLAEKIACCDGFFCPDDRVTAILYRIFRKHNISLFNNIRVVSCNNDQKCLSGLYPRPATIDFSPDLTAELAVKELVMQINGKFQNKKISVIVRPELIENDNR